MLSSFQKECDPSVRAVLEDNGIAYQREHVHGREEEYIHYSLPDFSIWIYEDGGEISDDSRSLDERFERYDFDDLSALGERMLERLDQVLRARGYLG